MTKSFLIDKYRLTIILSSVFEVLTPNISAMSNSEFLIWLEEQKSLPIEVPSDYGIIAIEHKDNTIFLIRMSYLDYSSRDRLDDNQETLFFKNPVPFTDFIYETEVPDSPAPCYSPD